MKSKRKKMKPIRTKQKLEIKSLKNGVNFYILQKEDSELIDKIWREKIYNRNNYNIRKDFIVIDIGAHIGSFTVYAGKKAKNVYCYEPVPDVFKVLEKNIKMNKLKNIFTNNCGVLNKRGERRIFINKSNISNSFFYKDFNRKSENFIRVKTIILKDVFEENKIKHCDVMKIDAEGSEQEILKNAPEEYLNRVDKIILEYHNFIIKNDMLKLVRILTEKGFKIEELRPLYANIGIIFAKRGKNKKGLLKKNCIIVAKSYPKYIFKKMFEDSNWLIGQVGIILKIKFPRLYRILKGKPCINTKN